jgi:hypothetical protein
MVVVCYEIYMIQYSKKIGSEECGLFSRVL